VPPGGRWPQEAFGGRSTPGGSLTIESPSLPWQTPPTGGFPVSLPWQRPRRPLLGRHFSANLSHPQRASCSNSVQPQEQGQLSGANVVASSSSGAVRPGTRLLSPSLRRRRTANRCRQGQGGRRWGSHGGKPKAAARSEPPQGSAQVAPPWRRQHTALRPGRLAPEEPPTHVRASERFGLHSHFSWSPRFEGPRLAVAIFDLRQGRRDPRGALTPSLPIRRARDRRGALNLFTFGRRRDPRGALTSSPPIRRARDRRGALNLFIFGRRRDPRGALTPSLPTRRAHDRRGALNLFTFGRRS
jgi:hypothetical protein